MNTKAVHVWALIRIALGFTFFWAFLDKLVGLGYATTPEKAWVAGGSPTTGFLTSASGTFAPVFNSLAGNMLIDWLFMTGLCLIGLGLLLGIGVRLASYSGSLLLFMMWLAVFPPKTNPVIDDHIIYILALLGILSSDAGSVFGFGKSWKKSKLVKQYPILQ